MLNFFKKKNNESWESIKASGKAFPKTKISIVSFTGEDDEHYTAWISIGYKNYTYKEYCPILGLLNVDYEDMNGNDIGEIQEYFDKELNKKRSKKFKKLEDAILFKRSSLALIYK